MSTRWYPLYQKGNPQLRVFLPNFWMKLIQPTTKHPPNVVQFYCSMQMTKQDIQNYLEKIYNVHTVDVRTRIHMGRAWVRPNMKYVTKDDDCKVAYAILPKDQSFIYPNLFNPAEQEKSEKFQKKNFDDMIASHKKYLAVNNKPGVPGWFSI